jgi:hypothetical protein
MSHTVANVDGPSRTLYLLTDCHGTVARSHVLCLESPDLKCRCGDILFLSISVVFLSPLNKVTGFFSPTPDEATNAFFSHPFQTVSHPSPYN